MSLQQAMLWQKLHDKNLTSGDMPINKALDTPWYVQLMVGLVAWWSAFFFLGLIASALHFILDNNAFAILFGIMLIAIAYRLFLQNQVSTFRYQFALALSLAGQGLFIFGLFDFAFSHGHRGDNQLITVLWVLFVFESMLAWIMPSMIHRFGSALAAGLTLSFTLAYAQLYFMHAAILFTVIATIWLNEFNWVKHRERLIPIGYGLTIALIYQEVMASFYHTFIHIMKNWLKMEQSWLPYWVAELLIGGIMLWVVWQLLQRNNVSTRSQTGILALFASTVVIVLSTQAPGLAVGLSLIILGYANGARMLLSLGIVSLLFYISSYYYSLDMSLLEKAQILAVFGSILLLISWVMSKKFQPKQENTHAA
ncbi:MAG: DUF4401 domain-containing protein [Methylococcales bacterium]|nr:DUF4401 domain-containing protein [Methylococcales bacterium]MBT7444251.1 DUF4401 domain-containing protein [Methylococcales bacterium]